MRKSLFFACVLLGVFGLSGCAHYQPAPGERQVVGTVLGGVAGGLLGSTIGSGSGQVIATAGGAILGAILGNHAAGGSAGGSCGVSQNCRSNNYFHRQVSSCSTSSSGGCPTRSCAPSRYTGCPSDNCLIRSECADVRPCKQAPRCGQGYRLSAMDRAYANRAFQKAAECEIGHPVYWRNKPAGVQGSIRPIADGMNARGLYCREFQTTVYVDGRAERMRGKACRTRDGRWVPVI